MHLYIIKVGRATFPRVDVEYMGGEQNRGLSLPSSTIAMLTCDDVLQAWRTYYFPNSYRLEEEIDRWGHKYNKTK